VFTPTASSRISDAPATVPSMRLRTEPPTVADSAASAAPITPPEPIDDPALAKLLPLASMLTTPGCRSSARSPTPARWPGR